MDITSIRAHGPFPTWDDDHVMFEHSEQLEKRMQVIRECLYELQSKYQDLRRLNTSKGVSGWKLPILCRPAKHHAKLFTELAGDITNAARHLSNYLLYSEKMFFNNAITTLEMFLVLYATKSPIYNVNQLYPDLKRKDWPRLKFGDVEYEFLNSLYTPFARRVWLKQGQSHSLEDPGILYLLDQIRSNRFRCIFTPELVPEQHIMR